MGGAVEPQAPAHTVGLLMVHGIGQQRQGDPLRALTRALLEAVPELAGAQDLQAELTSGRLRGDQPAEAVMEIRVGSRTVTTWLLAESLWADVHHPPSTWATLSYLVTQAPMLALARTADAVRNAYAQWWDHPLHWWRIATAAVLAVLVQPVVLAVLLSVTILTLVRGLIPLEWLKAAITRLEAVLTQVLGDSVLFATDELSLQAMATKVQEDLTRVRSLCGSVIVVAHSQGAAVVVRALREGPDVDRLITLGAGIGPLEWLRRQPRWVSAVGSVLWLVALGLSALMLRTIVCGIAPSCTPSSGAAALLGIFGPVAVGFVGSLATGALASASQETILRRGTAPAPHAVHWTDLHATADPVPGGPLTQMIYGDGVHPRPVRNHNNLLRDHTTYLDNRGEVVDTVLVDAMTLSNVPEFSAAASATTQRTDRVAPLRHQHGRGLAFVRWLFVASVGFTVVAVRDQVASVGAELLHRLPGSIANLLPESVVGLSRAAAVGVVAVAVVLLVQYSALVLLWSGFGRLESAAAEREEPAAAVNAVRLAAIASAPAIAFLFLVFHPVHLFRDDYADVAERAMSAAIEAAILGGLVAGVWHGLLRRVPLLKPLTARPSVYAVTVASAAAVIGVLGGALGFMPWESLSHAGVSAVAFLGLLPAASAFLNSSWYSELEQRRLPSTLLPPTRSRPGSSALAAVGIGLLVLVEGVVLMATQGVSRVVLSIAVAWAAGYLALFVEPTGAWRRVLRAVSWVVVVLLVAVSCQTVYLV